MRFPCSGVLVGAFLLVGCATAPRTEPNEQAKPNVWYPPARPCAVQGEGTDAGARTAMCCPSGFVAGGSPLFDCPKWRCCSFDEGMSGPGPIDYGSGLRPGFLLR